MNQRIAFGAMVILLAANVLTQTRSPEFAALAGTYTAAAADGSVSYVLTLGADATATLDSTARGGEPTPARETGAWMLDGSSVQVALARSGGEGAEGLTLDVKDGAMVMAASDESSSRFAGLTFTRSTPEAPAPGEN